MGRLFDLDWSVLLFPEGELFEGGPLRPFMAGTGLTAVECRVPVVPVWVEVERRSFVQGGRCSVRGAFTVRIGEPVTFDVRTSYPEATARIEAAVRALAGAADG